jgi:acetylornithine deacetylase/succinyl-diaminopimelate desuccinylase-like protein
MHVPREWLDELSAFLRIPSVSADPQHEADVVAAGEWVCDFVRRAGGSCELLPTSGHPLAVGEIPASQPWRASRPPTVLVYGHFDVQPAGDGAAWESPAFEPSVRDGWLYARGAADDKGNLYMLLKAAALLAADDALPVNVRIACDGEEEIGGSSIADFLRDDEGDAHACVIFDGIMPRRDVPFFYVGTRGLAFFRVRVRTGARDLHSGFFGGVAANALHVLVRALASVAPAPDALQVGAVAPSEEEVAAWSALDPGGDVLAAQGARPADERAEAEFYDRLLSRAAVDVNGIAGGEPRLQKTVLPAEAQATLSIRLAPGQDVDTVSGELERLLREGAGDAGSVEVARLAAAPPGLIDPGAKAIRLAADAFGRALGRQPLLVRCPATLPIVPALTDRGVPAIVTGFDVPEGNAHAPNERLLLRYLPSGADAARETLVALGSLSRA